MFAATATPNSSWITACHRDENPYSVPVSATIEKVEIPLSVLESVETLDELEDWLMTHNPAVMAELRKARKDDQAGRFRAWKPRYVACPTKSK